MLFYFKSSKMADDMDDQVKNKKKYDKKLKFFQFDDENHEVETETYSSDKKKHYFLKECKINF